MNLSALTRRMIRVVPLAIALLSLGSCAPSDPFGGAAPRSFASDAYPEKLSEWRLLIRSKGQLLLNPAALDYDINMPLFSDYAAKYRSVWLPEGTAASIDGNNQFALPVGSIISKSFLYPNGHAGNRSLQRLQGTSVDITNAHLIETRLLVKQPGGWEAVSYLWQQNDAVLKRTGAIVAVQADARNTAQFDYIVPTRNECASCHALNHRSGKLQPIGLKPAQLTHSVNSNNQSLLARMVKRGWLHANVDVQNSYAPWQDDPATASVATQARDYLDVNCAHCHSAIGPAKTSGLDLTREATHSRSIGICKPPIAAGKGSGDRLYSIVPGKPEESILTFRLSSTDPSKRMPETGRSLTHVEGLQTVNRWISALSGDCL